MFNVEAKSGAIYVEPYYQGKTSFSVVEAEAAIAALTAAKEEAARQNFLRKQRRLDFEANLREARRLYADGMPINAIKCLREAWAQKDEDGQPLDLWTAKVLIENLCSK